MAGRIWHRSIWWVPSLALLSGSLLLPGATAENKAPAPTLTDDFCSGCHSGDDPEAGISFDPRPKAEDVRKNLETWDRVRRAILNGHMPPPGQPSPTRAERKEFIKWIDDSASSDGSFRAPTLRRLTKAEYENTIRDLTGVEGNFAAGFPSDDVGYGFDNIGDVLTLSPILMEQYLDAAVKIAELAIPSIERTTVLRTGDEMAGAQGTNASGSALCFFTNATAKVPLPPLPAGEYKLKIKAGADRAGTDPAKLSLLVGGRKVATVDVKTNPSNPSSFEFQVRLSGGSPSIEISFDNDFWEPNNPSPHLRDRNLWVTSVELDGPLPGSTTNAPSPLIRGDLDSPAAQPTVIRASISSLLERGLRRPPKSGEVDRWVTRCRTLMAEGKSPRQALRVITASILASPEFIFRAERSTSADRSLSGYQRAQRLSYFLWSSLPDEKLFVAARTGSLDSPTGVTTEARRMIQDPKFKGFISNFVGQWLQLRRLETHAPHKGTFPQIGATTVDSMIKETETYALRIFREDRSLLEFLDSDWTYANNDLSQLYKLPPVPGPKLQIVDLKGTNRGGLLTQASILALTSNPTRTSPVKRGKYVLEVILGAAPPPAPPGAGTLSDAVEIVRNASIRDRLAAHRKNPECASCHATMDGIGFALENFDASGAWRTQDGAFKVDPTGTLADGTKLDGAGTLKKALMDRKDEFIEALAERLYTYALGRGMTLQDRKAIRAAAERCRDSGYKFSALLEAILSSKQFLYEGNIEP